MRKCILVVDDTNTVRSLARFALCKAGYEILEAEDGLKGLEVLKKNVVHLILLDLNMPNMGGFEMVEKIKMDIELKNIPIFMLTADHSPECVQQGKQLGVMAWIIKPFVPDKLVDAVNKVLKKK